MVSGVMGTLCLFLPIWPQIHPPTLIWPAAPAEDKHTGARMEPGREPILQIIICLLFSHRVKTLNP